MNIAERISIAAEALDRSNKAKAKIRTRSSRRYVMSLGLKPAEKGGPIYIGQHEIVFDHGKEDER